MNGSTPTNGAHDANRSLDRLWNDFWFLLLHPKAWTPSPPRRPHIRWTGKLEPANIKVIWFSIIFSQACFWIWVFRERIFGTRDDPVNAFRRIATPNTRPRFYIVDESPVNTPGTPVVSFSRSVSVIPSSSGRATRRDNTSQEVRQLC